MPPPSAPSQVFAEMKELVDEMRQGVEESRLLIFELHKLNDKLTAAIHARHSSVGSVS